MDYSKEISKLGESLAKFSIPFESRPLFNGWQIMYPEGGVGQKCSVICHDYSIGHEKGLLEMMWSNNKDIVEGNMSADSVFFEISKDYFK